METPAGKIQFFAPVFLRLLVDMSREAAIIMVKKHCAKKEALTMNSDIIMSIVESEWKMFDAVNAGEARASCQDDKNTFVGMRRAQFEAWSDEACISYLGDLQRAEEDGRNLVTEKYIHMMKTTEPRKYEALLPQVTFPSESGRALAAEICAIMISETEELHKKYPYVSGEGRPLHSTQDFGGVTSVETYQLGELLTYSKATLTALLAHIRALQAEGRSLSRDILENSTKHYGYESLDAAEAATKKHVDSLEIEVSYGCGCGDNGCAI